MERARWATNAVALLLCSTASLIVVDQAGAAAQATSGSFACRASGANLLGVETLVANAPGTPCRPGSQGAPSLSVGSVAAQPVSASTTLLSGGSGATAQTRVLGLDLSLLGVRAGLVEASAKVACEGGTPRLTGTSSVLGLTVNGAAVAPGGQLDVPLLAGTLHLNHTIATADNLVVRAVWLETALGNIILGEARVGVAGNPCRGIGGSGGTGTITIVKDAQPDDSQSFAFTGDLGSFSLRDDGRSTGANQRTFSVPAGTYRISEPATRGGPVQRAWKLTGLECVDPNRATTVDVVSRTALVDLDPGEHVVCTFVNENPILQALAGAVILNGTNGVEPVVAKRTAEPSPATPTGDPAGVRPPKAPSIDVGKGSGSTEGAGGSALSGTAVALVSIPTVGLVGGGLWFLLLLPARRRREEEDGG